MRQPFAKCFLAITSSISYVSFGSQASSGLREGLMLLRSSWRYIKSEGPYLLGEFLIVLALLTSCDHKGSSLNNINVIEGGVFALYTV